MSKEKFILILSSVHLTEDLWQRPQQLAVQFAKTGYKVVHVNNRIETMNLKEIALYENDKIDEYFSNIVEYKGVYHLNRLSFCKDENGNVIDIRKEFLKRVLDKFGTGNVNVLVYLPEYANMLSELKEESDISIFYDCVDEMTGFHSSKKVALDEEELLEISDGVIVTAKTLYVHKSRKNENCIIVPNGVGRNDFEDKKDKPVELEGLEGPIVGYVGAIASWFDQGLMCEVARLNPDYNFILVGTIYTPVDEMEKVSNIHLLGRREYHEVSSYMQHFDVGIIPFKMEDLIVNTNPIKYFEYLSANLFTVSTPLPELVGFPECELAESANEFSNVLRNYLKKERKFVPQEEFLEKSQWGNLAKEIINFIEGNAEVKKRDDLMKEILAGYEDNIKSSNNLIDVLKAEIIFELGDIKRAEELLKEISSSVCTSIQLYILLKFERYKEIMDKGFILNEKDFLYLKKKGKKYLKTYLLRMNGQMSNALKEAESGLDDIDMYEELGNIYYALERYSEAVTCYAKVYEKNKKMNTLDAARGFSFLLEKLGKAELAKDIIQRY